MLQHLNEFVNHSAHLRGVQSYQTTRGLSLVVFPWVINKWNKSFSFHLISLTSVVLIQIIDFDEVYIKTLDGASKKDSTLPVYTNLARLVFTNIKCIEEIGKIHGE